MATKYEIRLITENDQPLKTAEKFWNYLSRNDASCIDYWKSIHVEKMIIFKFHDSETRDKALALEDFDSTLRQLKCKIPGSAPQGTDERSVFVNRLPSCLFIYFEPDTLESAIEHFTNQMYMNISNLFDHHLIRPPDKQGNRGRPTAMRLTFNTFEDAKAFKEENTKILNAVLVKETKRFHVYIPPKVCQLCRRNDHRRGSPLCDGRKRCPRCLSLDHDKVDEDTCTPTCWVHGPGHSSSSEKCPIIRKQRKEDRSKLAQKERDEIKIKASDPSIQPIHQAILSVQSQLNNITKPNSNNNYSGAAKTNLPTKVNPPNITPNVVQTKPFDLNCFLSSYYAACISEVAEKGSFQREMDKHYDLNRMNRVIHPCPPQAVLNIVDKQFNIIISPAKSTTPMPSPTSWLSSGASSPMDTNIPPPPSSPATIQPPTTSTTQPPQPATAQPPPPTTPQPQSSSSSSSSSNIQNKPIIKPRAVNAATQKPPQKPISRMAAQAASTSPARRRSQPPNLLECVNSLNQTKSFPITVHVNPRMANHNNLVDHIHHKGTLTLNEVYNLAWDCQIEVEKNKDPRQKDYILDAQLVTYAKETFEGQINSQTVYVITKNTKL